MKRRTPPKRPKHGAQVGRHLPWALIRWDMTQIGHVRRMRATHMPTGVAVESGGEAIAWSRLRSTLMPELALRVARKLDYAEPRITPPTPEAVVRADERAERDRRRVLRRERRRAAEAAGFNAPETDGGL